MVLATGRKNSSGETARGVNHLHQLKGSGRQDCPTP
jgi:hypothetical protein